MEATKKTALRWLAIAIALMLIGMVGASLVQSGAGRTQVKDIRWETTQGHRMSGLLFIPQGVRAEAPAPAVVVSHGMYNNREMQDLNFVELSRRGFVVLSMDMYNHGNSESWTGSAADILTGMYEAVKMLDSLAYVDSSRIGITGHSLGGMSSNVAVSLDNAYGTNLISAVLLNCADATYLDGDKQYTNIYGTRDVGILAAQYDEWFFSQDDGQGGKTAPRDFIHNSNAQSFLHFGIDPAGKEERAANVLHRETVDGQEAIRAVFNPAIIHPWSHFSQQSTQRTIEFFDAALGAPNPIASTNQVWQWKVGFNTMGLVGFGMFIVTFAILMTFTPLFSSLRAGSEVGPITINKDGAPWFWGSLVAGAIFGAVTYLPILNGVKGNTMARGPWPQSSPWGIGMWAFITGLFAILMMVVSYRFNGKKNGLDLKARGVTLSGEKLWKTIVLALIVVTTAYGWVFFADYFFKVDFRIWTLAFKAFEADKVLRALFPSAPLFLTYYIANSVAVNAFNYNDIGKKRWVNTAIVAGFNGVAPAVLLLLQYLNFFRSGHLFFSENMYIVWLFPILVMLPITAVLSRKIYRVTGNPYLPGIINGLLVTMMSCSNTLTWA